MSMMEDISKLNELLGGWVERMESQTPDQIEMDPNVDQYLVQVQYMLQINDARQKILATSLNN